MKPLELFKRIGAGLVMAFLIAFLSLDMETFADNYFRDWMVPVAAYIILIAAAIGLTVAVVQVWKGIWR